MTAIQRFRFTHADAARAVRDRDPDAEAVVVLALAKAELMKAFDVWLLPLGCTSVLRYGCRYWDLLRHAAGAGAYYTIASYLSRATECLGRLTPEELVEIMSHQAAHEVHDT